MGNDETELEARWREALLHGDELIPLPFPKRRVTVQGPFGLISVGGTISLPIEQNPPTEAGG